MADLQLPTELPLSLPSELARQRPDIRAAEALLQQAGAKVGVATANLYPQITLSATVGSLAANGSDLFGSGSGFYLLGASLTQPIFRGGELQAKRRAAVAAYEQAGAAYQEVVLQGLQNVADVLRALEADAKKLQQRADAAAQARDQHDIVAGALPGRRRQPLRAARRATQAARDAARAHAGRRRSLCRFGGAAAGARRRLVEGAAACQCGDAVMPGPAISAATASTIATRSTRC